MWTVVAISFQVFLVFMVGREIFEGRGELLRGLKGVFKSPVNPVAVWMFAYISSFIFGGVTNYMGLGLKPFCWFVGIVTLVGGLYFIYFLLSQISIDGTRKIIKELFSMLMLKFLICFSGAGLLLWLDMQSKQY